MSAGDPPTRVHVVRHGLVAASWRERIYGDLDVPLAPEGEAEAERAAERLRRVSLAAVVSSGLARAEFGAARIRAGRGLARRDEPALRELHRGDWTGLGFDELERREPGAWQRWHAEPEERRPPGGESLADLAARVLPALESICAAHAGAEVAIVSHSWVGRLVAAVALGLPPAACTRLRLPTGAAIAVDWPVGESGQRPTLAGFHLDRPPDRGTAWFRGPHRS